MANLRIWMAASLIAAGAWAAGPQASTTRPRPAAAAVTPKRVTVQPKLLDGHGAAVDALAHEVVIEGARTGGRVDGAEVFGDARLAGYGDAAATPLPEQRSEEHTSELQ